MENAEFKPGWEKDVYPTQDFLKKSIICNELYMGEMDGRIIKCLSF